MTDQDTIRILQSDVVRLTRANELLQARLDELRMVCRPRPAPISAGEIKWGRESGRVVLGGPATTDG